MYSAVKCLGALAEYYRGNWVTPQGERKKGPPRKATLDCAITLHRSALGDLALPVFLVARITLFYIGIPALLLLTPPFFLALPVLLSGLVLLIARILVPGIAVSMLLFRRIFLLVFHKLRSLLRQNS